MRRVLEKFDKPVIDAHTTWKEIFEVYDKNFEKLHNFLVTLGTNYHVDKFNNVAGPDLVLSKEYIPGNHQLMVFVDGIIQWVGEDYRESGASSITFLSDVSEAEEIRVVIIDSFSAYADVQDLVEEIREIHDSAVQMKAEMSTMLLQMKELYGKVKEELTAASVR